MASAEFILQEAGDRLAQAPEESFGPLKVFLEENRFLVARNQGISIRMDKTSGKLMSLCLGGKEVLHNLGGPSFHSYRFISNEHGAFDVDSRPEMAADPTRLTAFNYRVKDGVLRMETTLDAVAGGAVVPYTVVYEVHPEGYVDVEARFQPWAEFAMPRIGLQLFLNPAFEQLCWYGRGPIENYQDRKDAAFLGVYSQTVSGMAEPYVRAQSMGERSDTRWLQFRADDGSTVTFTAEKSFDFSAQHYTDRDLCLVKYGHDLDKIRRAEVVLNLDCFLTGLGNGSCGPGPLPQYRIDPGKTYSYKFRISR